MALDMETDVDLPQGHNSLYLSHTCEVGTEPLSTCWFTRAGFTHVYTINNWGEEKLRSLDMLSRCNWDSPVEEERVGARAYLKARLCDERRYWDWLEYGTQHPKMWPLVNMIDAMEPPPTVLAELWTDDAKAFRIGKVIAKDMLARALSKTVTRALEDIVQDLDDSGGRHAYHVAAAGLHVTAALGRAQCESAPLAQAEDKKQVHGHSIDHQAC